MTAEPFGKDHASRGGSYDTGKRIMRDVFGGEPPHPIPYEWISLKGQGDMSSSKGNLVSIVTLTQAIPPDVVRYLIFRVKPMRRIAFDPGLPLLNLMDEYDNVSSAQRDGRAADLARLSEADAIGVPFRHLVNLAQITAGDLAEIQAILKRHDLPVPDAETLKKRVEFAAYWTDHFSPPESRLRLQPTLPESAATLSPPQRQALRLLDRRLQPDMDGDAIHALVYALAEESGLAARRCSRRSTRPFWTRPAGRARAGFCARWNRISCTNDCERPRARQRRCGVDVRAGAGLSGTIHQLRDAAAGPLPARAFQPRGLRRLPARARRPAPRLPVGA